MTEEQLFQLIATTTQIAAANAQALAELRQQTTEKARIHDQEMAELRGVIGDLQTSITELREGQALLAQIFAQQQEQFIEFRQVANATLDRIDRTLDRMDRRDRGE